LLEKLIHAFFTADFSVFVLADRVVVRKGRSGIAAYLSGSIVQEYEYKTIEDLDDILARAVRTFNSRPSDRWFLGLPLKYFTLVNFSLPSAALDDLDEAVKYALMRHVPYDLDEAYISYQKTERENSLDICAMVISRKSIPPFLHAASRAGINLHSVFPSIVYWAKIKGDGTYVYLGPGYGEILIHMQDRIVLHNWEQRAHQEKSVFLEESSRLMTNIPNLPSSLYIWNGTAKIEQVQKDLGISSERVEALEFESGESFPVSRPAPRGYEVNLLPQSVLKQQMLANYLIYGAVIFFLLSLLAFPASKLAGQIRNLTKIEKSISEIKDDAQELTRLREESRQILDNLESMAEMKHSYPSAINILREMTEVIPETAWLNSLEFSGDRITMQGEADSATSVIEAVENSPLFQEVKFSSPVTKSGNRERFTLTAEVVP